MNLVEKVCGDALTLVATCLVLVPLMAVAQDTSPLKKAADTPQGLVDEALGVWNRIAHDTKFQDFDQKAAAAYGIFIAPQIVRAGVVVGGGGGTGVLMLREMPSGPWSHPAFYRVTQASVGFQIGVQESEVIMLMMSEEGARRWVSEKFQLGGSISVAAGEGAGVGSGDAEIFVYARSKGLYGGLTFDGAGIRSRDEWNSSYYGSGVPIESILLARSATNPGADALLKAVAAVTGSSTEGE